MVELPFATNLQSDWSGLITQQCDRDELLVGVRAQAACELFCYRKPIAVTL